MTAVVTKEAASNTSYNYHFQRNTTRDLNDIKVCIKNTMSAGGGIFPMLIQFIGFTDKEIPQLISSDLQDGKLPHHILSAIAKL